MPTNNTLAQHCPFFCTVSSVHCRQFVSCPSPWATKSQNSNENGRHVVTSHGRTAKPVLQKNLALENKTDCLLSRFGCYCSV